MNASVTSQSKSQEEHCRGRYLRRLGSQNGDHLVNICESKILETQVN